MSAHGNSMQMFRLSTLIAAFAFISLCFTGQGCEPGAGSVLRSGLRVVQNTNVIAASIGLYQAQRGLYCGATAVSDRHIVTARHCVDDVLRVSYMDLKMFTENSNKFRWATVISEDIATDFAVLETDDSLSAWVPFRAPYDGEALTVVRDFIPELAPRSYVSDLKMSIQKGDSGSGVFGQDGALVGVVTRCDVAEGETHCSGKRGAYSPIRREWLEEEEGPTMTLELNSPDVVRELHRGGT